MSEQPEDSAETARLLGQIAAGDSAAVGMLLDRHRGPVREFLREPPPASDPPRVIRPV